MSKQEQRAAIELACAVFGVRVVPAKKINHRLVKVERGARVAPGQAYKTAAAVGYANNVGKCEIAGRW